jgi:uncharacterized membrane protein
MSLNFAFFNKRRGEEESCQWLTAKMECTTAAVRHSCTHDCKDSSSLSSPVKNCVFVMQPARSFWGLTFGLWLLGMALGAAEPGLVTSPFAEQFFREKVEPIFVQHCHECHANGKHKGGLSMATLHDFLQGGNEGVVLVPGDTYKSTLIPAIRWEAEDEVLHMPPKEKLPDDQIAIIVRWVEMGAPWPVTESAAPQAESSEQTPAIAAPTAATEPKAPEKPALIGRLHPVVVHFPIACLLLAVLSEMLVMLRSPLAAPRYQLPDFRPTTALLILIGTLGAIAAVVSGTFLAQEETPAIERHQLLGWITLVGALGCSGLLVLQRRLPLRVLLVITAVLVGVTGHLGGELVYGAGWFRF